jgi:hypothetical protein
MPAILFGTKVPLGVILSGGKAGARDLTQVWQQWDGVKQIAKVTTFGVNPYCCISVATGVGSLTVASPRFRMTGADLFSLHFAEAVRRQRRITRPQDWVCRSELLRHGR